MPTRRTLLLGSAGALASLAAVGAGVEADLLPGRVLAARALGLNGPAGRVPDVDAGPVSASSFRSRARGRRVGYAVSLPPGGTADGLPVIVALHGLGGTHRTGLRMGLPRFQAAAVAGGVDPFAVVTVDGGNGYYHPHHGDDAGAMIVDELLPRLAKAGLDTRRLGLYGWSMGGYGALRIAGLLGPATVRGVAAVSPALWTHAGDASRSGFDDAAEYRRYSVLGHQSALRGIPVRLEVGNGDPFRDATRSYAHGFGAKAATLSVEAGAHDTGYWRRMLPGDLRFLGRRLAA
ncbi:MAG: alpha/beta hydrolase-fold protein [Nocardioides sp.]|uniref:alpha/beta hydrolase n=1 Tax=Nocardioides sp. TaxID=35761 RepID=UPI0039E452D0